MWLDERAAAIAIRKGYKPLDWANGFVLFADREVPEEGILVSKGFPIAPRGYPVEATRTQILSGKAAELAFTIGAKPVGSNGNGKYTFRQSDLDEAASKVNPAMLELWTWYSKGR